MVFLLTIEWWHVVGAIVLIGFVIEIVAGELSDRKVEKARYDEYKANQSLKNFLFIKGDTTTQITHFYLSKTHIMHGPTYFGTSFRHTEQHEKGDKDPTWAPSRGFGALGPFVRGCKDAPRLRGRTSGDFQCLLEAAIRAFNTPNRLELYDWSHLNENDPLWVGVRFDKHDDVTNKAQKERILTLSFSTDKDENHNLGMLIIMDDQIDYFMGEIVKGSHGKNTDPSSYIAGLLTRSDLQKPSPDLPEGSPSMN